MEETKEISKNAAEKARKKAEKAAKKAQYAAEKAKDLALRPKAEAAEKPAKEEAPQVSIFETGWLKRVYQEKPAKEVFTRFPPEPNGYLHIGHALAIAVDFGFAKHHGGQTYLRYDDTNPEKEEQVYFDSIKDIVTWLGFTPFKITYSSDHFDLLYSLAEKLILKDKAYVCHCTREEINLQRGGPDNRGQRTACKHRSRPVEESLAEFRDMRDGKYAPGACFLRMKQKLDDPKEGNPQMWDMAAYRITKNNHHPRTGDKWRIYPTYDFVHCLCDAFEGITHSLCTVEFELARESYNWLLEELDYKLPGTDEKGPMQRD
jgi:glutaminyl-tRNA synthetase